MTTDPRVGTGARLELYESQRIAAVRGMAAVTVCIAHAMQVFLFPLIGLAHPIAHAAGLAASYAVGVFFFVSGYVIAFSVAARRTPDGLDVLEFAQARAKRILPPFLSAVAMTVVVATVINGFGLYGSEAFRLPGDLAVVRERASISASEVLWTLSLSFNLIPNTGEQLTLNGPLWSLSYEVWLYAIAGLGSSHDRRARLLALALLAVPVLSGNRLFLTFACVWGMGFAVGSWATTYALDRVPRRTLAALGTFAIAAMLTTMAAVNALSQLLSPYSSLTGRLAFVTGTLGLSLLLTAFWRSRQRPFPLIRRSAGLGDISYTLYVMHFPLLILCYSILRPLADPRDVGIAVVFASLSLLAILLFVRAIAPLLERPRISVSDAQRAPANRPNTISP